ncbi:MULTISPECIES: DUF2470 domain-containing protein [Micromonospora]|uniref:DUF2470 domain-containing protein n=1 Tax=Micromonospora yangpuensis TaxID=683228 RepID=A0A1C6UVT4_9ACTN|nr:DUF2470 domain-containing protein [Micromonospora yangpuensis]GGM25683.1 hypothetical protein GCM10012279_50200 [Micromonospora yangpuensis]SCL58194.1 Protein of unknown function [Micromonospora yangpuensis]
MRPSPAEIVRTLVTGRLPALAHLARSAGPHQVRHATDPDGRVLLLVPTPGDLATALTPPPGDTDVATVLDVRDLPPTTSAPALGRAWLSGWAERLDGDEARQAAMDFAATQPAGDLLDVGNRFQLHRFEVAEARWEHAGATRRIDPQAYARAEPDPLHAVEAELLADLTDHHAEQVAGYLRRRLKLSGTESPQVLRIDRYGLLVAYGRPGATRQTRVRFARPAADVADLSRLLHPMLCSQQPAAPTVSTTIP